MARKATRQYRERMTSTKQQSEVAAATFDSLNPATGEVVATFPVNSPDDVRAAVETARPAARWWAELGFAGRKKRLKAWRSVIAARIEEFAALVHEENGKPELDAIAEIALAVEHLDWAAGHAKKVLGRKLVGSGLLAANHWAHVEYRPYGVVGVIGPWNYPVHTPMGSISYALAAGNAVVFKPSEYTPAIGRWLVDTFAEVVPEQPVFQLVTGFGATGNALCAADVDKLAFTGSAATGRKVMAACAEPLTPVVIECGGKDALIVADDADVDLAVDVAVWGGLSNAGQTCAGVERIYAVDGVYDEFLAKLTDKAAKARTGTDDPDYGPITMPSQIDVIRRHIDAALDAGARAVVGGRESVGERFVGPVVLVDVPQDNPANQEETFGPVLTVTRVKDNAEAIRFANGTDYALGAAVISAKQGREIADKLTSGMVSINAAIAYAMVPGLPFGGQGESGFGRIHGADGLREFAWPRAETQVRMPAPLKVTTFDRPGNVRGLLVKMVTTLWGRGGN